MTAAETSGGGGPPRAASRRQEGGERAAARRAALHHAAFTEALFRDARRVLRVPPLQAAQRDDDDDAPAWPPSSSPTATSGERAPAAALALRPRPGHPPQRQQPSRLRRDNDVVDGGDGGSDWQPYRVLRGHKSWLHCVAFAPDNRTFATGSADRTVRLWDTATGRYLHEFTSSRQVLGAVRAVAFHPPAESTAGRHGDAAAANVFYTGGADKRVLAWDARTGRIAARFVGHAAGVYAVAAHPLIEHVLVSGSADGTLRVWDARAAADGACGADGEGGYGARCVHVMRGHAAAVNSVVVRATEPQVVSGSDDATVRLWDLASGAPVRTLTRHRRAVRAVLDYVDDADDEGENEADGGDGGGGGGGADTRHGGASVALAPAAHDDNRHDGGGGDEDEGEEERAYVVSAGADGCKWWRLPRAELAHELAPPSSSLSSSVSSHGADDALVHCCAVNGDGIAALGDAHGYVAFYDFKRRRWVNRVRAHGDGAAATRSMSSSLAVAAAATVGATPAPAVSPVMSSAAATTVSCAAFDHSGSRLVTGGRDTAAVMWRAYPRE